MKKKLRFSAAVVFLFSMTPLAHAQQSTVDIPHTISYQGVIQSTAGMPLTGSQLITIRLYGDSAGMDLTWEDAFTTNVQNGVFNLLLGSQKPLPATSLMDMPLWIGVSIGEGEAMKPYAPLSASPYALTVANGSITAEKISADYVGSISINGTKVTGNGSNVNLMAGNGLQLSYDPVSSDIWLSAAEGGGSTGKGANTEGSSSIIGTNNEVFANGTYGSAQSGDVTLTTPQAIATSSSPTFANLTLSSNASISGTLGVTGATTTHGVTNTGDVSTGTIHTTALATLNSASITNDATVGGTLNMSNQQIQNVASPTASADAATKAYADNINSTVTTSLAAETARAEAAEATKLSLAGGTVTGSLTTEGAITTGNSISIDGTTSPRSILGDITTEISTSSGDLLLDPAGNVGIGTATPAYSLDVNGTFRVTDAATLSSSVSIGGALNLNSHQINNVSDPTSAQDAATKNYADNLNATQTSALNSEISRAEGAEGTLTTNLGDEVTRAETAETANSAAISTEASRAEGAEATKLPLVGGTMTGSINMNSNSITNLLDPINPQDAATKNYVDNGIAAATGNNYIKNGTSLQSSSNFNIDGNGTIGGSFLTNGSSAATPASGAGTRLMWSPAKGALRAGTANGTEWNDANIGSNSAAFGNGTTASGQYAFAAGQSTIASGPNGAAAFGNNTWSTGQADFAAGWYNVAGSVGSAVFGITNTAYGYASFAAGLGNHADDPWSTTLGQSASSNGYSGGFVFGDGGGTQTVITANDANYQFMARATGGFKFFADVSSTPGLTLSGAGNLTLGGTLNMNTNPINNVADPTNPQDAATKNYVDNASAAQTDALDGAVNGTPNSMAKFIGTKAVGNSALTDDGTNLSYAGSNINTSSNYQIGGNAVLATPGTDNLFAGVGTGARNTTGYHNTFMGTWSGFANTTGFANVFAGRYAGLDNTTGSYNVFSGGDAGQLNSSGFHNSFLGYNAGESNTTGFDNSFTGNNSGLSNTDGTFNSALGSGADVGSGSLTNATAIGANAIVNASNTIQLGNTSVTAVNTSGTITAAGFNGPLIGNVSGNVFGTASNVTGVVAVANGGTNGTASPTSGAVAYGTGTAYAFTAAGTTGQVLASAGSGTPTWTTLPASLSGSGTANTIPKFTGSSTIGNSAISDNGSTVSVTNSESVLFSGTWTGTGNPPTSSIGAIFEWIPSLGALRAGVIDNSGSSDWSTANIGLYSNAFGYDTKASGLFATAFGANTTASGQNSTALGYNTTASNTYATALGYQSQATGQYSTAMGATALASGNYSTAIGWFAQAAGIASFAAGFEATAYNNYSAAIGYQVDAYGTNTTALGTNASTNFENGSFIYGDGSAYVSSGAANSFTVLASGGTTFYSNSAQTAGVAFPANGGLTITGSASPITLDGHGVGTSGQVLASAGAGATPTWATVRKNWVSVPSSSSASGTAGDEAYDSNYLYICVSANTWERVGLSSW